MRSVYVIKAAHDLYKVGIAKNVNSRLKSHQTSNGSKVHVVTYARCGNALELESQVHVLLKEHVQPGGREWFKLTPEQVIKVCIYIHQKAEIYHSEDDIRRILDEYATHHESIVNAQKGLEDLSEQVGSDIQKAIGRLQRHKPLPKFSKSQRHPKADEDQKLYQQAVILVREENKASTSLLQRKLKIGYGRAARLVEDMENAGIVGPADGSKPRSIITYDQTVIDIAKKIVN